jgi:outer membrane protein assembly factor BamB
MTMRLALACLTLALAAGLLGCSSLPDPMGWFESDNQEPPAELTDYEPRLQLQTLWSDDRGAGSEGQYLRLDPAAYQGRILVADQDGEVHSLNAETGEAVWVVDTEAPVSGGPGVGDDIVLVGTRDAEVIALKEIDGEPLWRTRLSSEILSLPKIRDGVVVVHTIDGRLFGLLGESGERIWTYDRTEPVLTLRGSSSPVIRDANVITGFANGKLVNLNLYSGEPLWEVVVTPPRGRSELERIVDIDADPVLAGGLVFVCTFQGEVAAVVQDTGVVLWRRELSSHAGLAADWRQIYVTDSQSRVWALDPRNGAALWKQEKLLNRRLTAPAVLDDYVLVGDLDGYVHWLSYEDGSQLARLRVSGSPISSAPLVVDGVAYVYADDGTLAALAPATPVDSL